MAAGAEPSGAKKGLGSQYDIELPILIYACVQILCGWTFNLSYGLREGCSPRCQPFKGMRMCRLVQLVLEVVEEDLKRQCPIKLGKSFLKDYLVSEPQHSSLETIK